MSQRNATIREIAERAKVSIGTVDRVLHKRGRVTPETEVRVKKAIRDLNYRPNIMARQLKLSRACNLAMILPHPEADGGYWRIPPQGIKRAVEEFSHLSLKIDTFEYDRHSDDSFSKAVRKALKSKPQGLLIVPQLSRTAEEMLREIPPSLPYVFIDSTIPGAPCVTSIRQDAQRSGRLAARLMEFITRKGDELMVLHFLPQDYHIDERVQGFRAYFEHRSDRTLNVQQLHFKGEKDVDQVIKKIRKSDRPVGGLFVSNSLGFHFAQRIGELDPGGRKVRIIGYDLLPQNVYCLKERKIDFLIGQQPERQGYLGLTALVRHIILKEPVSLVTSVPVEIITWENVDEYLS